MKRKPQEFDVALSFAGQDRNYVEEVASELKEMGIRVFYDKYEKASIWGKNLYDHLMEVYRKRARFMVMFVSKHYADNLWTNHERTSAQARALSERQEYILPARFDDTEVPGLLPTIAYVDLRELSPSDLAELIKDKIGPISRIHFFPPIPDRLYDYLGIGDEETIEEIGRAARCFFDALMLMTAKERQVLAEMVRNCCPAGLPANVHINIRYLGRLVSLSRNKIIQLFERLDCLGIVSRLYESE